MDSTPRARARRYVVITPARDEAQYLETTIKSLAGQSVRPAQWIVVNDGSTDGTAEIIDLWAEKEPWIRAVHRTDDLNKAGLATMKASSTCTSMSRGKRARQAKEIEAFYHGYAQLTIGDWEYIVKLDGDVGFEPDYFEQCLAAFEADPQLGIGGGMIYNMVNNQLLVEHTPMFHVRGATKIYRRACWDQMGGVICGAGWDTMDEVKANMLGWSTRTFEHLQMVHYRFTGAANGIWQNAVKNGVWNYAVGYHPLFMMLKCFKNLTRKPVIFRSMGLGMGFVLGYIQRVPQIEDKALIRYLRNQQLRRLSFRATIWK